MALYQVNSGDRILAADINQFYQILKGVAASGESVTLIYNAAASLIFQPSSDPAAGTELVQIKNNVGTVQSALSSDGRLYPADGLVGTPGFAFELDKDTGAYRITANSAALVAAGAEQLRWTSTGVSLDGGTTLLNPVVQATWVPTLTQSGSVTFTNTYATYFRVGRFVHLEAVLAVTGSGTGGNEVQIGGWPSAINPVHSSALVVGTPVGTAFLYDNTNYRHMMLLATSATVVRMVIDNTNAAWGIAPGTALANGMKIGLSLNWEIS